VPLEDVVDGEPGAAALGSKVVAALGCGDHVLGDLRPANTRGRVELGELELPLGLHAGVLDRTGVHGADTGRALRPLRDLQDPRAELGIVLAVREEREHVLDWAVDHDRRLEPTRHTASSGGWSMVSTRRAYAGRPLTEERPPRGSAAAFC
jgi:hypothetical protein